MIDLLGPILLLAFYVMIGWMISRSIPKPKPLPIKTKERYPHGTRSRSNHLL